MPDPLQVVPPPQLVPPQHGWPSPPHATHVLPPVPPHCAPETHGVPEVQHG